MQPGRRRFRLEVSLNTYTPRCRDVGSNLWLDGTGGWATHHTRVETDACVATGWKTHEVAFVDRKRIAIEGCVGIASTGADDHLEVSHSNGFPNSGLGVKPRVFHAHLEAGVDGLRHEPRPLRT